MRNEIFRKIKSLGVFKSHKITKTSVGRGLQYKYYPSYMEDTHYTLIIFIQRMVDGDFNDIGFSRDFRLYVHNNVDGSFNKSHFQISDSSDWDINYLNEHIDEIFKFEFRANKLKKLSKKIKSYA